MAFSLSSYYISETENVSPFSNANKILLEPFLQHAHVSCWNRSTDQPATMTNGDGVVTTAPSEQTSRCKTKP
jgi:hypothetical protein